MCRLFNCFLSGSCYLCNTNLICNFMATVFTGKYIKIETATLASAARKTPIYDVLPLDAPTRIGQIRWWSAWRCFTYWPERNTIYERNCLVDITKFLDSLAADRKAKTPYPQ